MDDQKTPIGEAISMICIASILVAVLCFSAATANVPVVTQGMIWIAIQIYSIFPKLGYLRSPQIPIVASSAAVGLVFFFLALGFAPLIARYYAVSQMASIERQTANLKRNRARITQARRDRDNFNVH